MALDLSGGGESATIAGLTSLQNVAGCTMMAWVLPRLAADDGCVIDISVGTGTGTRASFIVRATGVITIQGRADDAEGLKQGDTGAGLFSLNVWSHFAATIDYGGDLGRAFVNGVLVGTIALAFTGTVTSNTASVVTTIGVDASGSGDDLDGIMEDVRIYNRILGPNELLTIASQRGPDNIMTGLQNKYLFNERAPGVTPAGANAFVDMGLNRFNATPVGSVVYAPGVIRYRNRPQKRNSSR